MGLVGLVLFLNVTNMKVSGISLMSALSNWTKQVWIGMCMRCTRSAWNRMIATHVFATQTQHKQPKHLRAILWQTATHWFLTVGGNKSATESISSKWHLEMHFAVHTQRHDNPLPRCSMLACGRYNWFCVICVVRSPSRSAPPCASTLNVRGMGGSWPELLHANLRECILRTVFSINSPLKHNHAWHCGMNARQICVPRQHETNAHTTRNQG